MAEEQIPNSEQIKTIPNFMREVGRIFGIEVPIDFAETHPLFAIWTTLINVTKGTTPAPRYIATGDITQQFPFNFAQSTELKPVMKLAIDVFKPAPELPSLRGVKVTVFQVPNSTEVVVRHDKDVPPELESNSS